MPRKTVGNEERRGILQLPAGTATAPSITTSGDTNTGVHFPAADQVGITAGGVAAATFSSSGIVNPTITGVASFPDGSASAPSITNTGDTDTGLAFPADDTVIVSTGGTERVRVQSNGNVGIGTTNASSDGAVGPVLMIAGGNAFGPQTFSRNTTADASASYILFEKSRSGGVVSSGDTLGVLGWRGYDGSAFRGAAFIEAKVDGTPGTNDMPGRLSFATTADGASSVTERMRITSNGSILIGRTYGQDNSKIGIGGSTANFGANVSSIYDDTSISSNTSTYTGISTYISTAAASFTVTSLTHFRAGQFTIGAGSSVTNQYGFLVAGDMTGAGTNYGFFSAIASGSGRWNYYAAGTADNYFAGNVGIGIAPTAKLHVSGTATITGTITTGLGAGYVTSNSSGVLSVVAVEDDQPILASQIFG